MKESFKVLNANLSISVSPKAFSCRYDIFFHDCRLALLASNK
jgi:hypothetical protein